MRLRGQGAEILRLHTRSAHGQPLGAHAQTHQWFRSLSVAPFLGIPPPSMLGFGAEVPDLWASLSLGRRCSWMHCLGVRLVTAAWRGLWGLWGGCCVAWERSAAMGCEDAPGESAASLCAVTNAVDLRPRRGWSRIAWAGDRRQLADGARDLAQRLPADQPTPCLFDIDAVELRGNCDDEMLPQTLDGIPRRQPEQPQCGLRGSLLAPGTPGDRANRVLGHRERVQPRAARVQQPTERG